MAGATSGIDRFDGEIAGFGTSSGTRVVLGMWRNTPFGPIADAMIERADGHRVLVAPSRAVADYIAATYTFDEIRVEAVSLAVTATTRTVRGESFETVLTPGRRSPVGWLLRLVPPPLARARWWLRVLDPVAAWLRPGVHTVGTAGNGRREYYGARDEHRLTGVEGQLGGVALGAISDVEPPVRFGFGSTPTRPSIVRVTTTIVR